MEKKSSRSGRKYFIKVYEGLMVVYDDFFNEIVTRQDALALANEAYLELNRILIEDAVRGKNSFLGNMKIITGLKRTLTVLEYKFPFLMHELYGISSRLDGKIIFKS